MDTKVLVVEDDLEINELLGEYLALEKIGYIPAASGQEGIHLANSRHPDAIILDLMLPDIDGFQVARTLTTQRATHDIPIVILSCMCQECDKQKGYASGALFFINKPFLPDDLLTTVAEALEWKAVLPTRIATGSVVVGNDKEIARFSALRQMTADIFARTDLSDADVGQIRQAIDLIGDWVRQWNAEHPKHSQVTVDYRLLPPKESSPGQTGIEWKLTEDAPGLLAEDFFKTPQPAGAPAVLSGVGGLIGWGASAQKARQTGAPAPLPPPAKWLQILTKTGAARFDVDAPNGAVRFTRPATTAGAPAPSIVPAEIEIGGMRQANRRRDEPVSTKQK